MRHDDDDEEREFQQLAARSSGHVSTHKNKTPRTSYEKVPWWWSERVIRIPRASAKTMFVGIWLFRLRWKHHSLAFPVPNGQLAARGVNRAAKNRALRQLEAAGLIVVDRRNGKTPEVTLVLV